MNLLQQLRYDGVASLVDVGSNMIVSVLGQHVYESLCRLLGCGGGGYVLEFVVYLLFFGSE